MVLNIEDISKEVKSNKGLDIAAYNGEFLVAQIKLRMQQLQIPTSQRYLEYMRQQPEECDHLLAEIGVNVSRFFRNPLVFELIYQSILPQMIKNKRKSGRKELRIWCAGCSGGEEPYSIAILLHKFLQKEINDWQLHIFATDIDRSVLQQAHEGLYHRAQLADTKLSIVDNYFIPEGDQFRLRSEIRECVNFSFNDLADGEKFAPAESVFATFDLVFCRNVLIYFNEIAKAQVVSKMIRALRSRGYLVLGESEWIPDSLMSAFIDFDHKNRIYRKK